MALVLETPKTVYELKALLSSCDSLNSLQLRAVLGNYQSEPGEIPLSADVINQFAEVTAKQVDEQLLADGRKIVVNEPLDLQLPFLLPEDGYSCDYVKGLPPGLAEFVDMFVQMGLCRLTQNPTSSGLWTVYMMEAEGVLPGFKQLADVLEVAYRETVRLAFTYTERWPAPRKKCSMSACLIAPPGQYQ